MTALISPKPFVQRKRLLIVQILCGVAIALMLVSRPAWDEMSLLHEGMEAAGALLILVCMFGRLWSILYVGGRKTSELVTSGPYSLTRNPLYLFSTVGVFGVGLVFGSVVVALVLAGLSYLVFEATARKEAAFLRAVFPRTYPAYEARTPSFWPDFSLYIQPDEVSFSPVALKRTFLDALYFLAMIPLIEGVEYAQLTGYMPTFLRLP